VFEERVARKPKAALRVMSPAYIAGEASRISLSSKATMELYPGDVAAAPRHRWQHWCEYHCYLKDGYPCSDLTHCPENRPGRRRDRAAVRLRASRTFRQGHCPSLVLCQRWRMTSSTIPQGERPCLDGDISTLAHCTRSHATAGCKNWSPKPSTLKRD